MYQRTKEETIEIGDQLIFNNGDIIFIHSIIPMQIISTENQAFNKIEIYIGLDTKNIKLIKKS